MVPVAGPIDRPPGNPVADQVYDPVPPVALIVVAVYTAPAVPAGRESGPVMLRAAGHCTVVVAADWSGALLPAVNVAVFAYAWHPALDVALEICTEAEAPGIKLPNAQATDWLPSPPVIAHVPGPPYAGLMLQVIPVPDGSGSLSATLVALAVAAAALRAVIVNPMGDPALTVAASAVLLMLSTGAAVIFTTNASLPPARAPCELPDVTGKSGERV
jgi:hypothetical protein